MIFIQQLSNMFTGRTIFIQEIIYLHIQPIYMFNISEIFVPVFKIQDNKPCAKILNFGSSIFSEIFAQEYIFPET